ncbi:J domain-containing protein [Burkholderia territorii]|uniref:J domain-containing protein n=1 Tax=Burkholderia territorii TaxID=1503055 RepID=UPI0009BF413F
MKTKTHYDVLSVARDAPPEVVRAAYKALSQKWHPDKNPSAGAAEVMRVINVAYAVLSDATARTQ